MIIKRILSICLAVVLTLSTVAVSSDTVFADRTSQWAFTGADCSNSITAISVIDYIQAKYPNGTQYKGDSQCFGYAEMISGILADKRTEKYYKGLKFNKKNLLAKCSGMKAGTHIRISNNKEYSAGSGHSIVLLKVTKNKVYWTEANVRGYNNIRHACATPEQFINYYDYQYLNAVFKATSYKTRNIPLLASEKTGNGKCKLFWTRTTNTAKYKVYRATSKTGTYKLLKTTTKKNFIDTTAKKGTKYYYKVRAIKKNGNYATSGIISFKRS